MFYDKEQILGKFIANKLLFTSHIIQVYNLFLKKLLKKKFAHLFTIKFFTEQIDDFVLFGVFFT